LNIQQCPAYQHGRLDVVKILPDPKPLPDPFDCCEWRVSNRVPTVQGQWAPQQRKTQKTVVPAHARQSQGNAWAGCGEYLVTGLEHSTQKFHPRKNSRHRIPKKRNFRQTQTI